MRCIKHVIRYISIKQLWNLSKYVLNNQGCRWLTDWTREQRQKEPVWGTEGPSPESWEGGWFCSQNLIHVSGLSLSQNGSQAHKGHSVNFKTSRWRATATEMKDRQMAVHKNASPTPCVLSRTWRSRSAQESPSQHALLERPPNCRDWPRMRKQRSHMICRGGLLTCFSVS